METITLNAPLTWQEVAAIAEARAPLALGPVARERLDAAQAVVQALSDKNIRAYGINTGVGALSDMTIGKDLQGTLSKNILMSHAVGIGTPLGVAETRAIMVAAINNFALGYSGIRLSTVERIVTLLNAGCTPEVPHQGSVGYISHMAQIGAMLIGYGHAVLGGERMRVKDALSRLGLEPLVLQAKEGLCLVNGTPCVTGLACLALSRSERLIEWADAISAMTFETQRCQTNAFASPALALRTSPGLNTVAAKLGWYLQGSDILTAAAGRKTQDALSLRGIPHVHGAVRDAFADVAKTVSLELESVTDNPAVAGTPDAPEVFSQAHAIGASMGLAMDHLGTAMAELGAISERRLDRMINPLVSGLPAFLAAGSGVESGFMIPQYAAVSLVGENRRLAAPASLDGGITSALQEDILVHSTPAALKALDIIGNVRNLLAIEYLAAAQSYDLLEKDIASAPRTQKLYRSIRAGVSMYRDDRPFGEDIATVSAMLAAGDPLVIAA